jgi:hypothetical protein
MTMMLLRLICWVGLHISLALMREKPAYTSTKAWRFCHGCWKPTLIPQVLPYQNSTHSKGVNPLLTTFGPFIVECANAWATRNLGIPQRLTSFTQRVKYFDELLASDASGSWYSGTLEAANSTIGNLMEVSLRTINELVRNVLAGQVNPRANADLVRYIRAELGDADLHGGLLTIYRNFQGILTNHTTVEGQLISRLFHRLRCVLLILVILETPDIQSGIASPRARLLGRPLRVVISFCQKQLIGREGPIEDYYLLSWHNFSILLLGGLALTTEEYPECKHFDSRSYC